MRAGGPAALLLAAIAGAALLTAAAAQQAGQCGPQAIGLARTHEIDTKGGPRFGANQYPGREFLKRGEVVLTFDDGPHKMLTQPVLDTLAAHCTKATFFMVGQRAIYYPEMVREIARRGHTVATHSWSHQNQAQLAPEQARAEIELGISGVQKALGQPAAPFFRFPYLSDPRDSQAHLRSRNTAMFSIDVDSYDFKTRSPTVVIRNVMQQLEAKGSGIILFHDIQPSTAGALNDLLNVMKAKGYRVVHIVPRQAQVTVAEYDKRVTHEAGNRRFASLPPPVAQRGIVSPAWEVRIFDGPGRAPTALGPAAVGGPAPIESPRPVRRPSERDWRPSPFAGN
jgi:peptidoglycan/xylan/chitin deacetylase (PgdA/CDA1 family)